MFTPINFQDKPNETTPLSAANLNHMQTQHSAALADVEGQLADPESPIGAAAASHTHVSADVTDMEPVVNNIIDGRGPGPAGEPGSSITVIRLTEAEWPGASATDTDPLTIYFKIPNPA